METSELTNWDQREPDWSEERYGFQEAAEMFHEAGVMVFYKELGKGGTQF